MAFTTAGFLEVAIKGWPEWNLFELVTTVFHSNPLTKELQGHEFYSHSEPNLYNCFSFTF